MHRFYLAPDQCREPSLRLAEREAHHAIHVLRVRRGERVAVLDGAGHEFLCEVKDLERDAVQLAVVHRQFVPPLPCQITLLQAIPKGKLFESIVQKTTELGVARIVPILSERVVAQLDEENGAQKADKWRNVAVEAIKQCGSPWLPQIESPVTSRQFLARKQKIDLPLIASLQDDRRHPRECFREFQVAQGRLPASVCIWIGPEGDFTPAEMNTIKAEGALPITLGRLVLRSETAAVYCLSILNYEFQSIPD
jgi:16S rRNA (uracil1498-N3)-methyltransferase